MKRNNFIIVITFFLVSYLSLPITIFASTLYFPHTNHQGSVIGYSDENGNLVGSERFYVFGEEKYKEGDTNALERAYTGQVKDKTSDLYYYNARYYDPELSVFISPDPAGSNLNAFGYVSGNPVNFTDPTGLMPEMEGGGGIWNGGDSDTDYPGGLTRPPNGSGESGYTGGWDYSIPEMMDDSVVKHPYWSSEMIDHYFGGTPYTPGPVSSGEQFARVSIFLAIPAGGFCLVFPYVCASFATTITSSTAAQVVGASAFVVAGVECKRGNLDACGGLIVGYQMYEMAQTAGLLAERLDYITLYKGTSQTGDILPMGMQNNSSATTRDLIDDLLAQGLDLEDVAKLHVSRPFETDYLTSWTFDYETALSWSLGDGRHVIMMRVPKTRGINIPKLVKGLDFTHTDNWNLFPGTFENEFSIIGPVLSNEYVILPP